MARHFKQRPWNSATSPEERATLPAFEPGWMYVYVLMEPDFDLVRYVGCTNDPVQRLQSHRQACQPQSLRKEWLDRLRANGQRPRLLVIDKVPQWGSTQREREWIAYYAALGADLLNGYPGRMRRWYPHRED